MAETSLITRAAQGIEPGSALAGTGANVLGQTLLWLLVVVGLILALAWLAKRVGGMHFQNAAGMKMLSVLPVGTKEKIALVQVGDKQLLLGIAPGRVTTLHVFDESVSGLAPLQNIAADRQSNAISESDDSSLPKFQQILVGALSRMKS